MTIRATNRPWMWAPAPAEKMYKRCSVCGRNRRVKHFHRDRHKPDGRVGICRDCRKARREGKA